MDVNQTSTLRILRAALFGFVLFLIGYMIPHPGALATTDPQPTINSVPGGFSAVGTVTINAANLTCLNGIAACSYTLNIQAGSTAGSTPCPAVTCTAFDSSQANFAVTWYDTTGATPWPASQLYAYGTVWR
jgi:hypothetical protein